jgi:hypothetical protein
MSFLKLTFKPGINREKTQYASEGGWYESQLVRFRQGFPEKIGGWTQYSANTFLGVCRSLWNWFTLSNISYIGVGTNLKFYITSGNFYYDITPIRTVNSLTNPFTTTSGSKSVKVTDTNSGFMVNDFVTFSGATAVGGLTLNGTYQVTTVISGTAYTITSATAATSSSGPGGGTVSATYQLNTGPAYEVAFNGWGAGAWGGGTWGNGNSVLQALQIWNQYNYGQDLIYGPRGGGLYYWTAANGTGTPGVNLNTLGGTVTISIGSPALIISNLALPNGSAITFATTGALPTGLFTGTQYYVINASGTQFNVALSQFGMPINTSGTQSGTQSIAILGDVPIFQNNIIVSDASRFVLVFGCNNVDSSTINPMLIRWSDQSSPYVWYPSITNQAGGQTLSHGSQIITVIQTRQEILAITDAAVYSIQYVGPPFVWGTQLMGENISIMGPNAATLAAGIVYWMGRDKFYMYTGQVMTLPSDLRRFVFENLNQNQAQQVYASTSEGFNEIWWFYVSGTGTQINTYVVYNYVEQLWYYGSLARTAWLDTGLQSSPVAATYNGYLVNQESGVDNNETGTAAPIDAYITSSEIDIAQEKGERFAFVDKLLPDVTFTGSTSGTIPQATMTIYPLTAMGSGVGTPNSPQVNYIASVNLTEEFTDYVYVRIRGRQLIIKMESNKIGTTWQLGSPLMSIRADGRR